MKQKRSKVKFMLSLDPCKLFIVSAKVRCTSSTTPAVGPAICRPLYVFEVEQSATKGEVSSTASFVCGSTRVRKARCGATILHLYL